MMVATRMKRTWPQASKFEHQENFDDQQESVEGEEACKREDQITDRQVGCCQEGWQDFTNCPGLAAKFSNEPAKFTSEPRNGNREDQNTQKPAFFSR